MQSVKPLGHKAYGSIPHLPGSRLGPADHHCQIGQANIATIKTRDKHDIVIVQEKLDGSNVAVAKINNKIFALTRSGYIANTSPYEQHHMFEKWVFKNFTLFYDILNEGERICGEWLAQAHSTRYNLKYEPFIPFDIFNKKNERYNMDHFCDKIIKTKMEWPTLLHKGGAISISQSLSILGDYGYHGAIDKVEGLIYRIERNGKVDFLIKYVRPDKIDGKYFPENNNGQIVWNI